MYFGILIMKRVFLIVLDSFGIGSSPDADKFNDVGADTFGHIVERCFLGEANTGRNGALYIPNLVKLGLVNAAKESKGKYPLGFNYSSDVIASYGFASEISSGKDTTSGHWEIAGVPVLDDWFYFSKKYDSFSNTLLKKIIKISEVSGFIGNCHASGTDIINDLGEEHIKTKKPIIYTSSDSVFQVACHEVFFGLRNLYKLCETIRFILDQYKYKVARVIARPFIGNNKSNFQRTGNRRDFSIKPFSTTVMKKLIDERKGQVVAIGKVSDIYGGVGISKHVKSTGLDELCNTTINEMKVCVNNTIIFTNLVDFDSSWGHRRDVSGYARGLEFFDHRLSEIINLVQKNDLLILTADHGCDPTWKGTDHTRENVPILIYSPGIKNKRLGHRKTFSDIGQTIAKYFLLSDMPYDVVLMPGDPVRAKYISEKYLNNCIQINNTRLMLAYTGFYKNRKISIMSHGIGIPSASLYTRELIIHFNVKKIIRIGTCGAVRDDIKLRDIVISMGASTDSKVNRTKFNNHDFSAIADFDMIYNMFLVSKKMNIQVSIGNFFTTDSFYDDDEKMLSILKKYNIIGVDMETAGIYAVASELKAQALSICTVSDHITKKERLSSKDRESGFNDMIELALESTL